MKKEGKWITPINIFMPLIILIIGYFVLEDKIPVYIMGTIWIIFTIIPLIILKFSKWKTKRKDIFSYKYSTPLTEGIIISGVFFLANKTQNEKGMIIWILVIFILIYLVNHLYISKKYPDYYFKS